jgi:hypothetical protein
MKEKIGIIEVGSTNTKGYICEGENVEEIPFINIEFKKNYKEENKIAEVDKQKLYNYTNKIKENVSKVYVYGTSIFRNLNPEEREQFLKEFKQKTNSEFNIVSSQKENEYTVFGAINNINYDGNIAVMIGGGGSTEIAICNNNKIIEMANTNFGVVDTFEKFSDLNNEFAYSNRDEIVTYIIDNLNKPKMEADILILAGGNYILCYNSANYPIEKNTIYSDEKQPYMISKEKRDEYDLEYYYNINLNDMRKYTPDNPNWWNGTRVMCSFAKAVSDITKSKYIIPTSINMVYGIIAEIYNN